MKIEVVRHYFSETYTIGKLYIDGVYFSDTLEPSVDAKKFGAVKLGSYPLNIVWSAKFGCYMPRIEVPHRSGILFHAGNFPKDSKGCVLLGYNTTKGSVTTSRLTFHNFVAFVFREVIRTHSPLIIVEFKNK